MKSILYILLCGFAVHCALAGINEWTYVGLEPEAITDIEVDPVDPQTVFVSSTDWYFDTTREGGIFKTTDHGVTWDTLGFRQFRVHDLFVDPYHPDTIWAACDVAGVYVSSDGGTTWNTRNSGLFLGGPDNYGAFAITMSPFDGNLLMCGEASDVVNGRLYRSTNGGENWTRVLLWWNAAIPKVVFDPFLPQRVWIHDPFFEQILVSVDSGQTFNVIEAPELIDDFALDPFRPDWIWGIGPSAFLYTTDAGETWIIPTDSFPGDSSEGKYVRTSPVHQDVVFAASPIRTYFSGDAGQTWTSLNEGWPQQGAIVRALKVFDDVMTELWAGSFYHGVVTYTFGDTLSLPPHAQAGALPLVLYPNPAMDHLTLVFPRSPHGKIITIYNLLGQRVYTESIQSSEATQLFNVGFLPSGNYFLRIDSRNAPVRTIVNTFPFTITR